MLNSIVEGTLDAGSIYALTGIGFVLVWSATKVMNLAQGYLAAFVAIFIAGVSGGVGDGSSRIWLLLLAGTAVGVGLGAVEYWVCIRIPLARGTTGWVVTTIAAGIVAAQVSALIWGNEPLVVPSLIKRTQLHWVGVAVSSTVLLRLAAVAVVATLVVVLHRRLRVGRVLRAVAENRELAALRGARVEGVQLLALCLAGAVAGLSASFIGPTTYAYPSLGVLLTVKGFTAVAIGGLTLSGALLGGFALALVEMLASQWLGGSYQNAVSILVLLLVLLIRPTGLFGGAELRRV